MTCPAGDPTDDARMREREFREMIRLGPPQRGARCEICNARYPGNQRPQVRAAQISLLERGWVYRSGDTDELVHETCNQIRVKNKGIGEPT